MVFEDYYTYGANGGQSINTLFDRGVWVDITQIPILNPGLKNPVFSAQDLAEFLYWQMVANLINAVWKQQGVYIMAYEKSQDDCKHI
jgi:hypothetical protein